MDVTPATAPLAEVTPATLFVALELSRSMWLVAMHSPIGDKISQHRLDGGDTEGGTVKLSGVRRTKPGPVGGRDESTRRQVALCRLPLPG